MKSALLQLTYVAFKRYEKTGNKKHTTCVATLLQNEMKSDVARFTTHVRTCQQPDLVQDRSDEGGKKRNVVFQLVLQQCCKANCMFFVACFPVPLVIHVSTLS